MNFQRCERTYGPSKEPEAVPLTSGMSETAARPPSPVADDPSTLPSPTSSSQWLFLPLDASLWMPGIGLLQWYFSRYCTVRLKMIYFLCLFFMYYLCKKHYKPVAVQHCIVDCISWVPRLTFLERTNWAYECSLRMELVCMQGTYCTVIIYRWNNWS